jgi:hypothetical protein
MVWNIFPTKSRISCSILSSPTDISCSLCSFPTDSMLHLFFTYPIARVVWRNSFWPLDSLALRIDSLSDWLSIILHPKTIGIPISDSHMFQIFTSVAYDQIWFARNKAIHEDLIPNALDISASIKRIAKSHHSSWNNKRAPHQAVRQFLFCLFTRLIMIQLFALLFRLRLRYVMIIRVLLFSVLLLLVSYLLLLVSYYG